MKDLYIKKGFEVDTDGGYFVITGRHFNDFSADEYTIDEDGNGVKTGSCILTKSDIKQYMHRIHGKAYDLVIYDDEN